ncbi:MAG: hypothetical protein AAFX79_10945 [Planctomycetota bacterium]
MRTLPLACVLAASVLMSGCYAARLGDPDANADYTAEYGTVGGIASLPTLRAAEDGDADLAITPAEPIDVMDRRGWSPTAVVVPSDLVLHPPHYLPPRLPVTGDRRYHGDMPMLLGVHDYGSGNWHQFKSLITWPWITTFDLAMIPVRAMVDIAPWNLDASPSPEYERAPHRWADPLPRTGQPVGEPNRPRGVPYEPRPGDLG